MKRFNQAFLNKKVSPNLGIEGKNLLPKFYSRRSQAGFTLIELLVVISIIALLMAVLIPSLARARIQAKRTICQTHLKQWGAIYTMYTNDNDSRFPPSCLDPEFNPRGSGTWFVVMRPYYQDPEILECAAATKAPEQRPERFNNRLNWRFSWWGSPFTQLMQENEEIAEIEGSYGQNWWITSTEESDGGAYPDKNKFKRITEMRSPRQTPMLGDCGAFLTRPTRDAQPPENDGDYIYATSDEMRRVCTNRHQTGGVNWVFADGSVSEILLKNLWETEWHKNWESREITEWPDWMRSLPE
ncbi:prepilin-type N-terminal cleavage/methylation domain-containing protein [Sedimentisphaera salicampi]|uniref:prepilin-type N-terminal cleavage/methylation domain-containing protein n=1 Tax=Sedimentisphaera salicampi TaxID=1941349 RepID=UPI000B9D294C|nr:prepilin-type N-terminal cleavage/methylation domain-containing protein [Sedimentisphaera salicampi]OXU15632.1 PilD-dependent protein PddA [Sedimentisphaera salicampi]